MSGKQPKHCLGRTAPVKTVAGRPVVRDGEATDAQANMHGHIAQAYREQARPADAHKSVTKAVQTRRGLS